MSSGNSNRKSVNSFNNNAVFLSHRVKVKLLDIIMSTTKILTFSANVIVSSIKKFNFKDKLSMGRRGVMVEIPMLVECCITVKPTFSLN